MNKLIKRVRLSSMLLRILLTCMMFQSVVRAFENNRNFRVRVLNLICSMINFGAMEAFDWLKQLCAYIFYKTLFYLASWCLINFSFVMYFLCMRWKMFLLHIYIFILNTINIINTYLFHLEISIGYTLIKTETQKSLHAL